MQDKANIEKRNGNKWHPALVAVIGAILGSSGGVALVFNTPLGQSVARPDPYTGTQAASLKHEVDEVRNSLNRHTSVHPDTANRYDRRIATLEAQYTIILSNQERILNRLDDR